MSSSTADRPPGPARRTAGGVALAVALTVALAGAGCTGDNDPVGAGESTDAPLDSGTAGDRDSRTTSGSSSAVGHTTRPAMKIPPDVVAGVRATLEDRAAALRAGDPTAFEQGLAPDAAFVAEQQRYFANLRQLPLAQLRYDFDPRSMVRAGGGYWVVVEVHLQLEGYDVAPVVARDRYRFVVGEASDTAAVATMLLTSVTDRDWERQHEVRAEPWDSDAVVVRQAPGVLGVFDQVSAAYADALMPTVSQGVAEVAARVPYSWSRTVVLYALSESDYLAEVPDLPGGDPERLDGVAFPVFARPDGETVASTRFVLHPRLLTRPGPDRERLVRHELTHVALGERDDEAPVWLGEGLAEYVSVRAMAPQDRRISQAAIEQAVAGVRDLPDDAAFTGEKSRAQYGLAWWACEYLAATYGEPMLWRLLDGLTVEPDVTRVLGDLTGLNTRQLARKGARLLVQTYAPEELAQPSPSETPSSTAGPSGSGTPTPGETGTPQSPGDSPQGTRSASG